MVQLADVIFTKLENCIITAGTGRTQDITFHGKVCREAMLSAHGFRFCLWLLTNEHKTLPEVMFVSAGCCVSSWNTSSASSSFLFPHPTNKHSFN